MMSYRITLRHPCGIRQVVTSHAEASLLIRLGWQFVCMHGRSFKTDAIDAVEAAM